MKSVLIVLGVIVLVTANFFINIVQTRGRVRRWAEMMGYSILQLRYRAVCKGPFTIGRQRGSIVYRIHVEDKEGRQRNGFVRAHGWFWSLWYSSITDSNVDAIWDKE